MLGTSDAEVTLQYPNALATVAFMFQTQQTGCAKDQFYLYASTKERSITVLKFNIHEKDVLALVDLQRLVNNIIGNRSLTTVSTRVQDNTRST